MLCFRGAAECIRALSRDEPGDPLGTEVVQRLTAACDTLGACAGRFTELDYREQAAEAHVEHAHCLRSAVRSYTSPVCLWHHRGNML